MKRTPQVPFAVAISSFAVTIAGCSGEIWSGMVCGGALMFSSSDPAVVETGTFMLTSGGQATKQSHYRATESPFCEGDCADTLTRQ